MRQLVFYLMFAFVFNVFSASDNYVYLSVSFGTDGSSGESLPDAESALNAQAIYDALNVPVVDNTKAVVFSNGLGLVCDRPQDGIHSLNALCRVDTFINKKNDGNIIEGKLAEMIYNALNIEPEGLIGGAAKKIANLMCVEALGAMMQTHYSCMFTNAIMVTVPISELFGMSEAVLEATIELLEI